MSRKRTSFALRWMNLRLLSTSSTMSMLSTSSAWAADGPVVRLQLGLGLVHLLLEHLRAGLDRFAAGAR